MKPNVLILMVDQLNYQCLGYKHHPVVRTPNLDLLKQDSVEFTRCYVQNAFCMPSRTSYLTGQYVFKHRQYGFHGLVSEDTPSMPALFADNGYRTFHCGKAHIHCLGELMGFSEFVPTLPEDTALSTELSNNYQVYCRDKGYEYPTDQIHGGQAPPARTPKTSFDSPMGRSTGTSHIPLADSVEAYTSGKAREFLLNHTGDPFFLHVSFDRPHPPLTPSEPYDDYYDPESILNTEGYTEEQLSKLPEHIRKFSLHSPNSLSRMGSANMKSVLSQYFALITHIDEEIGKIVSTLRQQKLYDNTIILFYSDHGDMAGFNGLVNKFSNQIFHDNIIRTPMLIKLPGQAEAGREIDDLTEAIDVFPTLAALCGLEASHLALQGRSMMKLLEQETQAADRVAFSESYGLKVVVKDVWKLIYYVNSNEGELYNLASDPEERTNRYAEPAHADKVTELKLEIVKKLTVPVSERRKNWIRGLFDNTEAQRYSMMEKLYKWDRNIADGGGFWVVCRDGYRLFYIPFDGKLNLEKVDTATAIPNQTLGMIETADREAREALINELLNYLATTIRPLSLMSGKQPEWDNLLQTKGAGFC